MLTTGLDFPSSRLLLSEPITATQIKNSTANAKMMSRRSAVKDSLGQGNISVNQHINALQALSNGQPVPYPASLRIVTHHGDRAPIQEEQTKRRPPGYIRNESGGFFTS